MLLVHMAQYTQIYFENQKQGIFFTPSFEKNKLIIYIGTLRQVGICPLEYSFENEMRFEMVEFFSEGYLIGPPCLVLRNKFTDFGDEILMNNLLKKENIITKM